MLSLRIVEQPARYHRFRYETEIVGGKLGGLLYGRSGSKSCVRLSLTGVDPARHRSVVVIGGTVNPEGCPHPFFMHGDGCESGAFQWKRDVVPADAKRAEFEICLEKVSLVCVPQGGDKLLQATKKREAINFNPYNKTIEEAKYTSRNLRELRLAFQVYFVDPFGLTIPCKTAIVQTDIISDIKFQAKLEIEDLHPSQGFLFAKEHVLWVHFRDQLPHSDVSQFSSFLDLDGVPVAQCAIRSLKKQLMVLCIPQLSSSVTCQGERLRFCLRVNDLKSDVTAEQDFVMCNFCNQCGLQILDGMGSLEPLSKRKRAANGDSADSADPTSEEATVATDAEDMLVSVVKDAGAAASVASVVKPE